MRYMQASERWCADYSLDGAQVLGRSRYEIFPDIPDRWKQLHRRALKGETLRADEDRWDREGGTTWLRREICPWQNLDGMPGGILIFSEDITHRKQIEESLSEIPRKLIEAQEQERTRIGRELHDDIGQRLSLLAFELEQLHEDPSILREACNRIDKLQKQTSEMAADVQSLSHELHSASLQYLGIAVAMRNFCRGFGEQQRAEIDFQTDDLRTPPCRRTFLFASSEFYKKPSTMPQNTAGCVTSKYDCGKRRMRFISMLGIQAQALTAKRQGRRAGGLVSSAWKSE